MLPVVTPATLQISARGRAAFRLVPIVNQQHQHTPTNTGSYAEYLAPEFRAANFDKRTPFTESDIEKVCGDFGIFI